MSVLAPHAFTGKCQAKGIVVCPVDLRIPWSNKLLFEERLAKMRWSVAVRQAVGYHEPLRPWERCRCGRIFFKFTRKQVRREKVPWGWTPSTEWHCVRLVLICAAGREWLDTLWPAGDVSTVRWLSALWQYYDTQVLHDISARLQETASALPCTYIGKRDTLE